jgi:hypothetical protein
MSETTSYSLGMQDHSSDGNEENAIDFLIEQALNRRHHATLVKVVRGPYDSSGTDIPPGTAGAVGFIDVQPLVNQVDGWGIPVPHTVVYHLNYHRTQGGGNAFICDPVAGDIGKVVISDRDTSIIKATGAPGNPGSQRRGSLSDGTYIGNTQGNAPTQFFAWLEQGFKMRDGYGNTIIGTAAGVVINGVTISQAGEITNPANTAFSTHKHTNGNAGADTGIPVPGS